jgi:hypothetical protein
VAGAGRYFALCRAERTEMSCAFETGLQCRFVQRGGRAYSRCFIKTLAGQTDLWGRDLGVPRDAGKLLLAGLPFVAGEDARGDVDQAGDEAEDGGGGPGAPVARAVIADV